HQKGSASRLSLYKRRIYLSLGLHAYTNNPISVMATSLCHPIAWTTYQAPRTHTEPVTRRQPEHACGWLVSMLYHGRAYTDTRRSTGCPSTTPVYLALGPDSTWEDELDPGTLSQPAGQILTIQFVTHDCILTRTQSTTTYSIASTLARRSPTQITITFAAV